MPSILHGSIRVAVTVSQRPRAISRGPDPGLAETVSGWNSRRNVPKVMSVWRRDSLLWRLLSFSLGCLHLMPRVLLRTGCWGVWGEAVKSMEGSLFIEEFREFCHVIGFTFISISSSRFDKGDVREVGSGGNQEMYVVRYC